MRDDALPDTKRRAAAPRRHGLPPVLSSATRVLILGSFPSEASLAAAQYYAHPRNHFWPILAAVLAEPLVAMPYANRLVTLKGHRVGVWDTIVACERPGSLDADIRNALRADVAVVRRRAPLVRLVCFNGQTAARARSCWDAAGYATLALPSTSPAYTRPLAEKLKAWQVLADILRA